MRTSTLAILTLALFPAGAEARKLPDLTVTHVTAPKRAVVARKITVQAVVHDKGGQASETIARAYLSPEPMKSTADYAIGALGTPRIKPGHAARIKATFRLPATKIGRYWLTVCANAPGDVKESNFSNSCTTTPRPTRILRPARADESALPRASSSSLPTFHTSGYTPKPLPYVQLPYVYGTPTQLDSPNWPVDGNGVYRYALGGREWDHPTNMAQYTLAMIDAYRLTHDQAYLARATANADRLLSLATQSRGGLYFRFPFVWANNGNKHDLMRPPWYSGMTNGLALEGFDRLSEQTGDQKWRDAADQTFHALLNNYSTREPWVSFVDRAGYLWAEEYAKNGAPMRVFNGHMEVVYGVYDYWRLTGSPEAARLFDGLVTTVRHYASTFRVVGGPSFYSLRVLNPVAKYQYIVVNELSEIAKMTGDEWFYAEAGVFHRDYALDSHGKTTPEP